MTTFFKKPQVKLEHFTNINNTNNNNNINNTNNTNLCSITKTGEDLITPAGSFGLASLSRPLGSPGSPQRGVLVSPAEKLNPLWKGLKIDIFNNGFKKGKTYITIAFGFIKQDRSRQELIAMMNSPESYIWRGVDDEDLDNFHWTTIRNIQNNLEAQGIPYRASKLGLKAKAGGTTKVCFLTEDDTNWFVTLISGGKEYNFVLPKNGTITQAQRSKNCVASKFIGQQMKKLISDEELGI